MDYRSSDISRSRLDRTRNDDGRARVSRPERPPNERERKEFKELVDKKDEKSKKSKSSAASAGKEEKKPSIFDLSSKGQLAGEGKGSKEDLEALGELGEVGILPVEEDELFTEEIGEINPLAAGSKKKSTDDGLVTSSEADKKNTQAPHWAVSGNEGIGAAASSAKGSEVRSTASLQSVVEQIAKEMALVQRSDRSETLLTLKHPPMFAGAEVNITEFKTARGEFNIRFSNLSTEAKALIDNQANLNALRAGLEGKGFALHIVTSTTDPAPIAASSESDRGRNDEGEKDQEQGEGKQDQQKQKEADPEEAV